jgi:hypothetical protein
MLGSVAAAWSLAAYAEEPTTSRATERTKLLDSKLAVQPFDPAAPSQLGDGLIDLMKGLSLSSSEGIGSAWIIPPTDDPFDKRYGQW